MKKNKFIGFIFAFCVFLLSFGITLTRGQDTLISFDDVEFSESAEIDDPLVKDEMVDEADKKENYDLTSDNFNNVKSNENTSWGIFVAGFIGGIAALLMPCIFPLLPLTVSYFTKSKVNRRKSFKTAVLYGFCIIVIYVFLGLLITVIFGAEALNSISTNGLFNFAFFIMLVVFGASFLGAFEIVLPSTWANSLDRRSSEGSFLGIFFMAATLAIVSFSCTGPIVGTLLVEAASTGNLGSPAIGMFGFSSALAIPFALFAAFPGFMKSLPKSGNWLNSVKVVLGFLELAFSLKFLSNVDLAYHWEWLDREVFLALWISIFTLLSLYLLGKISLPSDNYLKHISVIRIFLSIVVTSFVIYMIPGLWGAPLKAISAFLPPQTSQDFDLYSKQMGDNSIERIESRHSRKYSDLFHAPLGLDAFFDYDEALAHARDINKPILIDFTGHACVNCREMEATVWTDPSVYKLLNENFVLVQLYVDDKTELPKLDQKVLSSGKRIKNIGNKWANFQIEKFNSNSQPNYAVLDLEGNILNGTIGATTKDNYLFFLQEGLYKFKEVDR